MGRQVPQNQSSKSSRKFKRSTLRISAIAAAAMAVSAQDTQAVNWTGGTYIENGSASLSGLGGQYYSLGPTNVASKNLYYSPTTFQGFQWFMNEAARQATLVAPNAGLKTAYSPVNFGNPNSAGSGANYGNNAAFNNSNADASNFGPVGFGNTDNIHARWVGTVNIPVGEAGVTTFSTRSDDGSVLFVDGVAVVDNNFFQGATTRSGSINLTAGEHEIVVGFYEGGGGAGVQTFYDPAGAAADQGNQNLAVTRTGVSFTGQVLRGHQESKNLNGVAGETADLSASTVLKSNNVMNVLVGTLNVNAAGLTLTNEGATYRFAATEFNTAGALTLTSQNSLISDFALGRLDDNGNAVTVNKQGTNSLVLDNTATANVAGNTVFNIQAGRLVVATTTGGQNPMGAATATIAAGAEAVLFSRSGNFTFNNDISGAGAVRIGYNGANAGTIVRTTSLNHTGATFVDDGTLELGTGGNIASTSGITVGANGGTDVLRVLTTANTDVINLGGNVTLASTGNTGQFEARRGIINIAGDIVDGGTSRLHMTSGPAGSNVVVNVNGGDASIDTIDWDYGSLNVTNLTVNTELQIRNVNVTSNNIVLNGQIVFDAAGNGTGVVGDSLADALNLNGGTRTFNVNNGTAAVDLRVDSIISNGGVTKAGLGTLVFNNANTYVGTTTINGGDLIVQSSGALGTSAGGTTIAPGGRLVATGGIDLGNENISIGNALPNAIINQAGNNHIGGTLTQTNAASATTGLRSDAGMLTIDGNVTLLNSGLEVSGAGDVILNGSISQNAVASSINAFRQRLYDLPQNTNDIRGLSGGTVQTIINTTADTTNFLTGHLNFPGDGNFNTEAGFDINGPASNYAAVWTTVFTPSESGAWVFRNNGNIDDNAGYWLDLDQNGVFSSTEKFADRGCCGTHTGTTSAVTAGQQYLLAFATNDTGGGGSYTDMEFAKPSAPGTFADLNPSVAGNAGLFTQSFASLTKTGAGKLTLNGAANFSQGVVVTGGTLAVNNTLTTTTVLFGAGTTYAGAGTINATTLTLTNATLAPGNSPGTSTFNGNESWVGAFDYNWQILDAAGAAGTGWDFHQINGSLDLTALTSAEINLWSLSSILPDVNGQAMNFDLGASYAFPILTASGGILGFDPNDFLVQIGANNGTAGFANSIEGGTFFVTQQGDTLFLNFQTGVPEPATLSLLAMGGLGLLRRRRRA